MIERESLCPSVSACVCVFGCVCACVYVCERKLSKVIARPRSANCCLLKKNLRNEEGGIIILAGFFLNITQPGTRSRLKFIDASSHFHYGLSFLLKLGSDSCTAVRLLEQ